MGYPNGPTTNAAAAAVVVAAPLAVPVLPFQDGQDMAAMITNDNDSFDQNSFDQTGPPPSPLATATPVAGDPDDMSGDEGIPIGVGCGWGCWSDSYLSCSFPAGVVGPTRIFHVRSPHVFFFSFLLLSSLVLHRPSRCRPGRGHFDVQSSNSSEY